MRVARQLAWVVPLGLMLMAVALVAAAKEPPKPPMFIRWLVAGDPSDEAIRLYWKRVKADEATPQEMIDLGTMLFNRGYPKDAIRMFERALDEDKKLYEAWFRIGLVEHREGNLRSARRAYRRCLKLLTGHGWCNFYMGLLEEQNGDVKAALYYYRRAFKFAPELSRVEVNPALLYSKLQLGAVLRHSSRAGFTASLPMPFVQPGKVKKVRASFKQEESEYEPDEREQPEADEPQPEPTPVPAVRVTRPTPAAPVPVRTAPVARPQPRRITRPAPPPRQSRTQPTPTPNTAGTPQQTTGSASGEEGTEPPPPRIPDVSAEASLLPLWPSELEQRATVIAASCEDEI